MSDAPKRKTTAKERAAEAVAVLERRRRKLEDKQHDLEKQARAVAADLVQVESQLRYAQANPLLKNTAAPVDQKGTR